MALIDDLRKLAAVFPPSHQPSSGELPGVVGALVTLVEHGPDFLKHLESDYETVAKFVAGVADDIAPDSAPSAPAPVAAAPLDPASSDHPASVTPTADDYAALVEQNRQLLEAMQELQAQVSSQAAAQRTVAASPESVSL